MNHYDLLDKILKLELLQLFPCKSGLMGGAPRDIMLGVEPKDYDICLDIPSNEHIAELVYNLGYPFTINQFGGIKTSINNKQLDLFALSEVLYFKEERVKPCFSMLPYSSLLNTEAIVITYPDKITYTGMTRSNRSDFFYALESRCVERNNLNQQAFPDLQRAKIVSTVGKLTGWRQGPLLTEYIASQ